MFHKEFYPTPISVIERMGIDCYNKVCYEPSAGKGDIVDYLKANGASKVIASEINNDLRTIVQSKCNVIGSDFFKVTADQVSHVQLIVMNPPFSNADKHILHAWEIAPEGCEIISLSNWETISKDWRYRELNHIIRDYGDTEKLGNCFDTAERKTNVEVGLLRLFKPMLSSDADWDGFYYTDEDVTQSDGIMPYNEIRAIVNSYVGSVQCFDKVIAINSEMTALTEGIGGFGYGLKYEVEYNKTVMNKEDFAKSLQKHAWSFIFRKMKLEKFVTSGVMRDINRFIESRQQYPFTMRNVYRMLEIIVGTRENTMNRAIEEAIDNLTKHTHENRYGVEGWKTNAGHLLNKKFIVDWMVENFYGFSIRSSSNYEKIQDLTKALCYVTGNNHDDVTTIYQVFNRMKDAHQLTPNTWYSAGFFDFKFFKKGTMHIKFQNDSDWEAINRAYAKIKGQVLPEFVKA